MLIENPMYSRPLVIGIDMTPGFGLGHGLEQMLRLSGNNSGNIMFSEALFRTVANAKKAYSYSPKPDLISDSDVIVVSAANWVGPHHDLSWFADWMDTTQLPVTIVGLGAQAAKGSRPDEIATKLPAGTMRALNTLSERSKSISVRGQFSQDVLHAAGIKNTVVTGCPSLLLFNSNAIAQIRDDLQWSDVVIHGTRYGWHRSSPVQEWFYRQSLLSGADLILQSEAPEIAILGENTDPQVQSRASDILSQVYKAPAEDVRRHISSRAHIFWTVEGWTNFLATKRFCLGSRIHGTIAALCAGIPATLVAHDSRTQEMATTMKIPFVDETAIDFKSDVPPSSLYDEEAMMRFHVSHGNYKKSFAAFFIENGLPLNSSFF